MKTLRSHLRSFLALAALVLLAGGASAQVSASYYRHARGTYESSRVWVPGRYETIHERVWVPGRTGRVWIEPVFEWRIGSCGSSFRVQVCSGRWQEIHHPGHYEVRPVRIWRPGYWAARGCR